MIHKDAKHISLLLQTTVILYSKHLALSNNYPVTEQQVTHPR